jgi:mono/diheme cytochrome c family protein
MPTLHRRIAGLAAALAALGLGAALATPQKREEDNDPDERQIQLASGRLAFELNCLMCHSEEMTTGSRLTPQQWATEVDKMIGWGAPVPKEKRALLVDYLSSQYPADKPAATPARLAPDKALALERPDPTPPPVGKAEEGALLYKSLCANCHGPDARGGDLGTNLVEKPVLFRRDDYLQALRAGRRRMPSYRSVLKPQDEADLLAWLQQRKND